MKKNRIKNKDIAYVWWNEKEHRALTFNNQFGEPIFIFGDEDMKEELERKETLNEMGYDIKNIVDVYTNNMFTCPFCEYTFNWDELNWVNSSLGICDECYQKIPTPIIESLENNEDFLAFYKAKSYTTNEN